MLTTNSSASIESKPSPSWPNSAKSSPICSGVICSIRFFTSIFLIWMRKSDSDINEPRFCRKLHVRSNLQERPRIISVSALQREMRGSTQECARVPRVGFRQLNLIGLLVGRDGFVSLRRRYGAWSLFPASRDGRLRGLHVLLGNFRFSFNGLVQFVVVFVLGLLKLFYRLTHSVCEFWQFSCSEQN